jgi:hypothetical protein
MAQEAEDDRDGLDFSLWLGKAAALAAFSILERNREGTAALWLAQRPLITHSREQ